VYHSILITSDASLGVYTNTWSDWHLIPISRPFVSLPSLNSKTVEIPGRNGSVDLTEVLTGAPTYSNRKGSWEFYVMHDEWNSWSETLSTIASALHGKWLQIILEDDPNYYYEGRLKVGWNPGKDYSTITIEYDLSPYKTNVTTGEQSLF